MVSVFTHMSINVMMSVCIMEKDGERYPNVMNLHDGIAEQCNEF